jgi:hypothetical protein
MPNVAEGKFNKNRIPWIVAARLKKKLQNREEGRKFDDGKPRWDLLPFGPVEDVVRVLTFGAKKYADNNWQNVTPFRERYFSAAMRHIAAYKRGEWLDTDSNLPHLAHAICDLIFLMWHYNIKREA